MNDIQFKAGGGIHKFIGKEVAFDTRRLDSANDRFWAIEGEEVLNVSDLARHGELDQFTIQWISQSYNS
jgi:hypothetical protein